MLDDYNELGDVNYDGILNILDVILIVNSILSGLTVQDILLESNKYNN